MGQSSSTELCLTPACLHASSYLIQNLAQNWEKIDPCTDFYEMACGGTRESWPDNTRALGTLLRDRNNRILRTIIESPYEQAIEYHPIMARNNIDEQNHRMLQQDYQSCMNEEAINATFDSSLRELLADFDALWPIKLNDTAKLDSSEYRELQEAIVFLEGLQVTTFKGISQEGQMFLALPDLRDPVITYPVIGAPAKFSLENLDAYQDKAQLAKLWDSVMDIFSLGVIPGLSRNRSDPQAQDLAKQVVEFEQKLAGALLVSSLEDAALTRANPEAGIAAALFKVPFAEFQSVAPTLGLDKVISFYAPAGYTPDAVILSGRSFFTNASSIVEESPKTVIQTWMVVRIVQELRKEFPNVVDPSDAERWENCLDHTGTSLQWIMDRFFVSAAYTDGMKALAEKMTTNIRAAMVKRIPELDWMTDTVKPRAIDKAEKMLLNIGYPTENPDILSPTSLADYYQRLNITDNYFSNVLTARINNIKTAYAALGKPVNRNTWRTPAKLVNAQFVQFDNALFINAGISQPALFHPDLPTYIVYGGLGSTIGHEITHGFDSNGHKFDERGAVRGWFDNSTSAAFAERSQCFIEEYGKFQYPLSGGKQQNVSGEQTLGENISDTGGLRIAFDAWNALGGEEKDGKNLPGLENFTHEQLFFLSWANGYCSTRTPERNEGYITDEHAPEPVRVMGGALNSRAFREAWNCPNKEPKCELF
ncbi:hypothetical protein V8F20_002812 [Naviculisporaceae sp. PSN 640]